MASSSATASRPRPPVVQPASGNSIVINPSQRLNPIVDCIRNVPKEFGDILPDYQVGRTTGVLFLSLRYHRLHPEYIHQRIDRLGQSYNLRILLLMCDISEHQEPIRELTKVCLINNITVIVAWSADEAGQYLALYKQSEHRPPTLIRERIDKTPAALLRAALTSVPRVNKTDVETLRTSFGSLAKIAQADAAQLLRLPGFGPKKVTRLKDAFERPFRTGTTSALDEPPAPAPTTSASKGKSKEKATPTPRPPSPVWDIELDLNSPSPPRAPDADDDIEIVEEDMGASAGSTKRARVASPEWDIERGGGLPDDDVDADEDEDMDLAPALRAKRRRAHT
ncbi:restriction endonuclease type II-like protein [Gloeopeniophorella convolvens]|nr:restriction endonuclease type II-like protein [Gloeopeniophorella convolvens]